MKGLFGLFATVTNVDAHGVVISPPMREGNYPTCPWCQGAQSECMFDTTDAVNCIPASPCMGSSTTRTARRSNFDWIGSIHHPDGSLWVDEGGSEERPVWCPGDVIPIRYHIHTDHNGVFRWEAQHAQAGYE